MSLNKKKMIKWFRILHRDIGYFAVGITLVYAISGVMLSHKDIFSATKTTVNTIQIPVSLNKETFRTYWKSNIDVELNYCKQDKGTIQFFLNGGKGYYSIASGETNYELYKKRPLIAFLNQLHLNIKKGWMPIADTYALLLIFLAISGLFMVQGKNGFLKRGLWLMTLGFVLVIVFAYID